MKELVRLVDGDANAAQRSLLEAAQAHRPPNDEARARTLAALTAVTGGVAVGSAAVGITSGKSLGAGAALARALSPALLKWCAVAAVGAGVSVSAVAVLRQQHDTAATSTSRATTPPVARRELPTSNQVIASPSAPTSTPDVPATPRVSSVATGTSTISAPAPDRAVPPPPPRETAAVVAPPMAPPVSTKTDSTNTHSDPASSVASPLAPAPEAPAPPRASEVASLSPEVRMLDEARAHVSSRDPAGALAALDRYTTAFPRGVFLPEARVLRIEALLLAGDRASATRLADDLLRTEPNGPYAQRVRKMMQKY